MTADPPNLPVLEIAGTIITALARGHRLVLTAPTGSGKTTQVPQIVHRAGIVAANRRIVILQPRRLATRMVAQRVAREMGVGIGQLVGYQTRHESKVSAASRIVFMTEGLLLRQMQRDPTLNDVGMVILDEFHERSLAADMSLGLLSRLQGSSRPDLKLIVMSATLEAKMIAERLQCEALEAGGRLFPVEVRYADKPSREEPWDRAAAALEGLIVRERGHANPQVGGGDVILIFMPGMFEITRTIEACKRRVADDDLAYFPLHGTLPPAQQDAAVAPALRRTRKVIVATNVAQTSITIDGVTAVIDSGLARIHRYDPQRALNVLRLEPISRASADQRAGRAGRTAPGVCIRLWTATDHARRDEHDEPEVSRLELSEAALQLKSMGVEDVRSFAWIEPPPGDAIDCAEELLRALKATDDHGRITAIGNRMADFPAHPRLARMMLDAAERGCLARAVVWAALISERDILAQPRQSVLLKYLEKDEPPSDLAARERLFSDLKRRDFGPRECQAVGASAITCREVDRSALLYIGVCRRLGLSLQGTDRTIDLLHALLTAFPDHVAMRLDPQRPHAAMPGRRKVMIDRETVVREAGPLVALEVTQVGRKDDATTNISLCSAIDPAWLRELHPERLTTETKLTYNAASQAVEEAEVVSFGGLELSRVSRPPTNHAAAAELLAQEIVAGTVKLDQWDDSVQQWIWRTRFVAGLFPERGLITYNDEDFAVIVQEIVGKAVRYSQVCDKPCLPAVKEALGWDDQQFVEKMAPESIVLPREKRLRIEYFSDQPPRGRAKIQELYDLPDTPKIAGGRHTIVLEILGPNYRPVQLTTDLKGFWERLYPELKKELKRRYPRHEWR